MTVRRILGPSNKKPFMSGQILINGEGEYGVLLTLVPFIFQISTIFTWKTSMVLFRKNYLCMLLTNCVFRYGPTTLWRTTFYIYITGLYILLLLAAYEFRS